MYADHKLCLSHCALAANGRNTSAVGGASVVDFNFMELKEIAFTATGVGQIVDLGFLNTGVAGDGQPVRISAKMVGAAASAGAPTLDFLLETDNDIAFGSATTLKATAAIALATLVAGYDFLPGMQFMSNDFERYARLSVDVNVANYTAGHIFAGVIIDDQSN